MALSGNESLTENVEVLPRSGRPNDRISLRRVRLGTLNNLRWMAIGGQSAALIIAINILELDQREAIRNGYRGIAQDLSICFRKLDFSLQEVSVPAVVWQGCADRLSKRSDCEYMVARMPQASFHRVPNQGHFFFVYSMDDVFSRLGSAFDTKSARAA